MLLFLNLMDSFERCKTPSIKLLKLNHVIISCRYTQCITLLCIVVSRQTQPQFFSVQTPNRKLDYWEMLFKKTTPEHSRKVQVNAINHKR